MFHQSQIKQQLHVDLLQEVSSPIRINSTMIAEFKSLWTKKALLGLMILATNLNLTQAEKVNTGSMLKMSISSFGCVPVDCLISGNYGESSGRNQSLENIESTFQIPTTSKTSRDTRISFFQQVVPLEGKTTSSLLLSSSQDQFQCLSQWHFTSNRGQQIIVLAILIIKIELFELQN